MKLKVINKYNQDCPNSMEIIIPMPFFFFNRLAHPSGQLELLDGVACGK